MQPRAARRERQIIRADHSGRLPLGRSGSRIRRMASEEMSRRTFSQLMGATVLGGALHIRPDRQSTPGDDLCSLTATELAARIRRKDVSAREVMSAHLARIERVN